MEGGLVSLDEVEQLRQQSKRWRELAWQIGDAGTVETLLIGADQLEKRASQLERKRATLGGRALIEDNDDTL
jgi:hypothetical protein